MPRKKGCCDEPLPVECPVYEKDLKDLLDGKTVEYPDPRKKIPVVVLVRCDSCKTILGRLETIK